MPAYSTWSKENLLEEHKLLTGELVKIQKGIDRLVAGKSTHTPTVWLWSIVMHGLWLLSPFVLIGVTSAQAGSGDGFVTGWALFWTMIMILIGFAIRKWNTGIRLGDPASILEHLTAQRDERQEHVDRIEHALRTNHGVPI